MTERAAPFAVGLLGAGQIGGAVAAFLRSDPRFRLAAILTRRTPEREREAFLAAPPPLVIDAAGPDGLRACGVPLLARAEVWSVGASALAEEAFLDRVLAAARTGGTRLRLFADWFGAADQCLPGRPAHLHVAVMRPGAGEGPGKAWEGSLRNAARLFPHETNAAVAAALAGPGLDRATFALHDPGPGGRHLIRAEIDTGAARVVTEVDFSGRPPDAPHPTAAAIVAALDRRAAPLCYG